MKRLILVVVAVVGLVVFSVGCQPGLSEGRVRDIVDEEVAKQLADIDRLTVSRLTVSCVLIKNTDGQTVAALESFEGDGSLTFYNADREIVASLSCMDGRGNLGLSNTRGEIVILIGSVDDDGALLVLDKNGELLFRGR